MINEVALVLLYGMFGWKVAGLYLITGLSIAILAGWIIGRLHMERFIEDWVHSVGVSQNGSDDSAISWEDRVVYGLNAVKEIVGKVWPYVLAASLSARVSMGMFPRG